MKYPNAIRKWKFIAEDEEGNCIELGGDVCFVGTAKEADNRCNELEDEYESKHGFVLCSTTLESQGIMWQGPGRLGGVE